MSNKTKYSMPGFENTLVDFEKLVKDGEKLIVKLKKAENKE